MPSQWVDFKILREQLSFAEVLEYYNIGVSGNGDQVKVLCPFHDDHKPSCGVNLAKQVFNCFACGAGGNALDFATQMEGLDPDNPAELRKGALQIAKAFGIDEALKKPSRRTVSGKVRSKPRNGSESGASPSKAKDSAPVKPNSSKAKMLRTEEDKERNAKSNQPLSFKLKLSSDHEYIRARIIEGGFSQDLVKTFGLGYCSNGMMSGRVCFPIHNAAGELIAYSGRWADEALPDETPRYLLPKGFEKSKVLFNLHRVLAARTDDTTIDTIIIVEGFWSVMRLHDAGLPCVSTFGDSVSPEQVDLLVKNNFSKAVLIFDGDEGGRAGITQSLPLLAERLFTKVIYLEDGVKPDTMDMKLVSDLPRYS